MIWWALATCLFATLVLAGCARALVAALPPPVATIALTAGAMSTSAGTGFVLAVIGFRTIATVPVVAALGGWNLPSPGAAPWVGGLAAVGALLLAARAGHTGGRQIRQLWGSAKACRSMIHAEGLVLTNDAQQGPYAIAGFPGRIVISTPFLAGLTPLQRRAVLAHESAHLSARHHLYLQLVEVAVIANPLLAPLRSALRISTERWADERAAQEIGDRHAVAYAIAAAAARWPTHATRTTTQLAVGHDAVIVRVQALLNPPRRTPRPAALLAVAVLLLPAIAAGTAQHITEHTFEIAQQHHTMTLTHPTGQRPPS